MPRAIVLAVTALIFAMGSMGYSAPAEARKRPGVHHHHHHHHHNHHNKRRGKDFRRGVAVGVGTALILNNIGNRSATCNRMVYKCNRGDFWACSQYELNCW